MGTTKLTANLEVDWVSQGWLSLRSQLKVLALGTALPVECGAMASSPDNPARPQETVESMLHMIPFSSVSSLCGLSTCLGSLHLLRDL